MDVITVAVCFLLLIGSVALFFTLPKERYKKTSSLFLLSSVYLISGVLFFGKPMPSFDLNNLQLINIVFFLLAAVSLSYLFYLLFKERSAFSSKIQSLEAEAQQLIENDKRHKKIVSNDKALMECAALPVLVCGKEKIVYANQALLDLLELDSLERIKGKHIADFSAAKQKGDDARKVITHWRRKLKVEGVYSFVWTFVTADHHQFECKVLLTPCFFAGEELIKLIFVDGANQIHESQNVVDELSRYQVAVESAGMAVCEWRYNSKVQFYSHTLPEILGTDIEALEKIEDFTAWLIERVSPDEVEDIQRRLDRLSDMASEPVSMQFHFRSSKGYWLYLEMVIRTHCIEGEYRIIATLSDVTFQYRQGEALRKLSSAVQFSSHATLLVDDNGDVEYANAAFSKLIDQTEISLIGMPLVDLLSNMSDPERFSGLVNALETGQSCIEELKLSLEKAEDVWCKLITLPVKAGNEGQGIHFVVTLEDITAEHQRKARLARQAKRDSLTGLGNRYMFKAALNKVLERCRVDDDFMGALLFIDLDDFKPVNDKLGHMAGDALLKEVATRLKRCVRNKDSLARLGGDEFTVLLSGVASEVEAYDVAQRILNEMKRPMVYQKYKVPIKLSMGMAFMPKNGDTPEKIIESADQAMYKAKKLKGSSVALFSDKSLSAEVQS